MKTIVLLVSLLTSMNVYAADYELQFTPAPNSVSNDTVVESSLNISKILNLQNLLNAKASSASLGTLSTKNTISNTEVADGSLASSKITNFNSSVLAANKANAVLLRYSTRTGSLGTIMGRVNFDTVEYNYSPGSVVTGGAWRFIAPTDGCFETKGRIALIGSTTTSDLIAKVYYNGLAVDSSYDFNQSGGGLRISKVTWNTESCILAGQTIYVEARNNPSGNGSLSATDGEVWITIRQVR